MQRSPSNLGAAVAAVAKWINWIMAAVFSNPERREGFDLEPVHGVTILDEQVFAFLRLSTSTVDGVAFVAWVVIDEKNNVFAQTRGGRVREFGSLEAVLGGLTWVAAQVRRGADFDFKFGEFALTGAPHFASMIAGKPPADVFARIIAASGMGARAWNGLETSTASAAPVENADASASQEKP